VFLVEQRPSALLAGPGSGLRARGVRIGDGVGDGIAYQAFRGRPFDADIQEHRTGLAVGSQRCPRKARISEKHVQSL
jgi:hypothetical protein